MEDAGTSGREVGYLILFVCICLHVRGYDGTMTNPEHAEGETFNSGFDGKVTMIVSASSSYEKPTGGVMQMRTVDYETK